MSSHLHRLLILIACLLLAGCATTRQPTPQRPAPQPMIGQPSPAKRTSPPNAVAATTQPSNIIIRATAPVPQDSPRPPGRPEPPPTDPLLRPAAGSPAPMDQPAKPASLDGSPSESSPPTQATKLRELFSHAVARYASIDDYICRFRRREFVNGKPEPEDLLEFKFRKHPFSIYFRWVGGQLVGRELIYVKGKYNNQLQIRTGKGDLISGFRTTLDPHSARATANSRRTVDEAGIGNLIDGFGMILSAQQNGAGTYGALRYLGQVPRPESDAPMGCVEQQIPPGLEQHLPRGGVRYWFFNHDERTREFELPVLIITRDEIQREVEYYCYDRLNTNIGLKPTEFDPEATWRRK